LPLERSRTRLAAEVPRLAASVATMERQAAEVVRVRSLPATPASAATPSAAIAAALGTRLPGAQASAVDEKRVRITGSDIAYGALLEAVASAQAAHGMRVDSARIDALPAAGRVRFELLLARS
jgi:type II secretory pathway component PulM